MSSMNLCASEDSWSSEACKVTNLRAVSVAWSIKPSVSGAPISPTSSQKWRNILRPVSKLARLSWVRACPDFPIFPRSHSNANSISWVSCPSLASNASHCKKLDMILVSSPILANRCSSVSSTMWIAPRATFMYTRRACSDRPFGTSSPVARMRPLG